MRRLELVFGTLFLVAGCSSPPQTAHVSGTVTVNGKAAPGVGVALWPSDSHERLTPQNSGLLVTDEEGHFSLPADATFKPGEYKVTFSRIVDSAGRPAPFAKISEVSGKNLAPSTYRERDTTPVVVRVTAPETRLDLQLPLR
jgi:5-hydroxyisourate hydrolase-like protein (transthyretin family)